MRKTLVHAAAVLFFTVVSIAFFRHTHDYLGDPDRYYHLALSRHMVEDKDPVPRTLPQAEGLHWDRYFPDKEFLFHQLTSLGYRLGGETGAVKVVLLVALLTVFALYFLNASIASPGLAVVATLAGIGNPYFASRELMLRPQVLAVFCFVLVLAGILHRKRWLAFSAATLMALAYHGLFIPVTLIATSGIAFLFGEKSRSGKKSRRDEWQLLLWALFGLLVGVLLNPYFPSNLVMSWTHMRIPSLMRGKMWDTPFGQELYPLDTHSFRTIVSAAALILLYGIVSWRDRSETKRDDQNKRILLFSSALFFLMTTESPRGVEYWIPVSTTLLVLLLKPLKGNALRAAVGISLLFPIYFLGDYFRHPMNPENEIRRDFAMSALEKIPRKEGGAFVFSCDWDVSPLLLYKRPDLRFIDILDPSFLYLADRPQFLARKSFMSGFVSDPYAFIHDAFHSDYVLCRKPTVIRQLQADPDFLQVYPSADPKATNDSSSSFLFRTVSRPTHNFVRRFQVAFLPGVSTRNFRDKSPRDALSESVSASADKTTFLNLFPLLKQHQNSEVTKFDAQCALVRPDAAELRRHLGAKYLALGGGRNIRVWRNGRPFYSSVWAFLEAPRISVLIPIPGGLKAKDKFEFMACSAKEAPFWGLAVSLWREGDLQAICREKRESVGYQKYVSSLWEFSGGDGNNCLGPILGKKDD